MHWVSFSCHQELQDYVLVLKEILELNMISAVLKYFLMRYNLLVEASLLVDVVSDQLD